MHTRFPAFVLRTLGYRTESGKKLHRILRTGLDQRPHSATKAGARTIFERETNIALCWRIKSKLLSGITGSLPLDLPIELFLLGFLALAQSLQE